MPIFLSSYDMNSIMYLHISLLYSRKREEEEEISYKRQLKENLVLAKKLELEREEQRKRHVEMTAKILETQIKENQLKKRQDELRRRKVWCCNFKS